MKKSLNTLIKLAEANVAVTLALVVFVVAMCGTAIICDGFTWGGLLFSVMVSFMGALRCADVNDTNA